eukprot:7590752-Pyramimonas_sp.AAC.1
MVARLVGLGILVERTGLASSKRLDKLSLESVECARPGRTDSESRFWSTATMAGTGSPRNVPAQ